MKENSNNGEALDALFWKEEILQVLYWMQGESLSDSATINRLMILLNTNETTLHYHLQKNIEAGYIIADSELNENTSYHLTPSGKKEAGNIFANAFDGMQKQGHGECGPDCDCQAEGHQHCEHEHHHTHN